MSSFVSSSETKDLILCYFPHKHTHRHTNAHTFRLFNTHTYIHTKPHPQPPTHTPTHHTHTHACPHLWRRTNGCQLPQTIFTNTATECSCTSRPHRTIPVLHSIWTGLSPLKRLGYRGTSSDTMWPDIW